jgi:hypothetical protein
MSRSIEPDRRGAVSPHDEGDCARRLALSDPRPPCLVTEPVGTTVVIVRQAFLKGSGRQIDISRPLISGWRQEERPNTLLIRATAKSARRPFLISQ